MSTKVSSKGSANVKRVAVKSIGQERSERPQATERKERVPGVMYAELPVYVVHSQLSVEDIRKTLTGLNAGHVGTVKIDYDRFGKETNRTIVIAEPSVYTAAVEAGLGVRSRKFDFAIMPYELRDHNKPFTDCLYSLYIPFPKEFDLSAQDARKQIEAFLEELVAFGLFADNDCYRITVPLKSREIGEPRGSVFVTFAKEVPDHAIELAKVVIDHNTWVASDEYDSWEELRCFWSRDPKQRPKAGTKKALFAKDAKTKDLKEKPALEQQVTGPVVRTFNNGKTHETTFVQKAKVVPAEATTAN